jgi:sulfonate transport system substrate-binding protein
MAKAFTRRTALALGAVTLATPYIVRAAGVSLRVGTFRGQDATLLPLAGEAATPYSVQYFYFNSGQVIIEAMNAGALDYGGWSEIPQAFAAASGAKVRAVAVLKGDVNDQVVLVPKASPVTDIAGLKGKRVGYVRATTSHYYLLRMLWQAGLNFSDIQAINLDPTDGAAAFAAGDLDAWAIYGYAIEEALAADHARVLRTANGILSGNYLLGAAPAALSDPGLRPALADYVARVGRAYAWSETHKSEWETALAATIQVRPEYVRAQLEHESQPERVVPVDEAAIASAQAVADTFAKVGLLPSSTNVRDYFDTTLI